MTLGVLLFFPVAPGAWFSGSKWGFVVAIIAPLIRFGFQFVWVTQATLEEAGLTAAVAVTTFCSFAFLIDLAARHRAEIHVLKGVLPTCAWCTSVRDGDGRWHQMETYLSERSDARFSHGICPECAKKNFGGGDG